MSNIIVRNVVGTGTFAIPTSDAALCSACASLQAILGGITDFSFGSCLVQVIDQPSLPQELTFVVDAFKDHGSWLPPSVGDLRTRISSTLLLYPEITSIGNIDFNIFDPYSIYTMTPQVEKIDAGIIYFKNEIPPGAQIEIYRYSRKPRGRIHRTYVCNGKRWRPDEMLPVGQLSYNAGVHQRHVVQGRTHFRFAYRWPAPPGSAAPAVGKRGPLSAYAVSTATYWERTHGTLLIIVPSPSGYWYDWS